jgi:CheY-like chemotaxis protein
MPHKLLLADDSVTIQRVIELTFADEDVQVIAVGDGRQAIERIEAERPDIVLADVGMPERDGYEVAAFVKNTAHLAHIPVLLLTGAFEPVDEQRASAAGCDGVLAKPFEPHMVITRVKELLASASDRDSARVGYRGADVPGVVPGRSPGFPRVEPVGDTGKKLPVDMMNSPEPAGAAAAAAAAEVLADASLRLSRRTPIAVPGFGAPAPPAETLSALDEYFDRLDAQFASLQQGPARVAPGVDESAAETTAAVSEAAAGVPGALAETGMPAPAEAAPVAFPVPAFEAVPGPLQAVSATVPVVPGPEAAQPEVPPPAPAAVVPPPVPVLGIAQAFSALFAAERGEVPAVPAPGLSGVATLAPAPMDDLVERVTRQVLDRLSDRVVRDTVTEIVSRVSERLVREEIERVKATLK